MDNAMDKTLVAEMQLVTPMFLGDMDPRGDPPSQVRPPSVKGALRFWWRALAWARFHGPSDSQAMLQHIHEREARLFGSGGRDAWQSRVLLGTTWDGEPPARVDQWPRDPDQRHMSGSTYLGWGIVASGRQANSPRHRIGWNEGAIFKLTLTFKPGTSASDQDEVLEALKAWSLLGGLGARSRRGFGSVALRKLQGENQMSDSEDAYRQKVRVLLQASASAPLAPYTALGCATRWAVVTVRPTAREAHEAIGVMYRQTVNSFDRSLRAAFGLPRPGQQSSLRRGSPLFLHVHPVGDHYVGAACWIPSDPFNPPRSVTREDLEHVADAFRFNWMTGGEK